MLAVPDHAADNRVDNTLMANWVRCLRLQDVARALNRAHDLDKCRNLGLSATTRNTEGRAWGSRGRRFKSAQHCQPNMSKYRHVQVRLIRMLLRRLAGFVRRCKSPDLLAERVGIHRITIITSRSGLIRPVFSYARIAAGAAGVWIQLTVEELACH